MESTKLMRWLWGEDQGGRISLYEPQREVVLSSLCLPLPSGKTRRFVGKVSRASRSRGIAPDSIYRAVKLKIVVAAAKRNQFPVAVDKRVFHPKNS